MKATMKAVITVVLIMFVVSIWATLITRSILLTQNCTGYLKRAADANTVDMASVQLNKAISYLENNNLTSGYTSVLWRTPDEDVGFWYGNLKASQLELSKVDSTTSSLEKSNLLMKLRETLMDNTTEGDDITVPDGLSRYPNNAMWGILFLVSFVVAGALVTWAGIELEGA